MTASAAPAVPRSPGRVVFDVLVDPWRTTVVVRGLARAAFDVPFAFVMGFVTASLIGASAFAAVTVVIGVPLALVTFAVVGLLCRVERIRAAALLHVAVPPPRRPPAERSLLRRVRVELSTPSRWRELAYLVVGLPFQGALGVVVLGTWAFSVVLLAMPFYIGHTAARDVHAGALFVHPGIQVWGAWCLGFLGVALVAPQLTSALVVVDRAVVRWLLGPRPDEELARRVGELEISRGAAVDQAEAERRRIERDLHDGAQQRLVALAMDLGRARERFDTDPEQVRRLVVHAHEEAKAALVELRDLARGIHPAVLAERGLDAALTSAVTRCPVPVALTVSVVPRPPAPVESGAYFVVAEALTNVAKHSRATEATVVVVGDRSRLIVEVRDNGTGGARVTAHGGLAGLSDRVTALGGWMRVLSPPGGPTSIVVELPCAS